MAIKQRAVGAQQKQQRITQILDATETRFITQHFNDIRLADIASDVGITKAALYRYFRTKEVLFLALYQRQIDQLIAQAALLKATASLTQRITQAVLAVPMYCKMTSILHTLLERNLTVEEALAFKRGLAQKMAALVGQIAPHTQLNSSQLMQRFIMLHHCIIGAWANCHPSDVVQSALALDPQLHVFNLDFEQVLAGHVEMIFALD
ncbi:TetR family transcriptional regulator [Colwellia sp. MEBiC06753]